MRRTFLLISTAAFLSIGAAAANAQEFTRPDTSLRALEPTVDLPFAPIYEGRSAFVPGAIVVAPPASRPLVIAPVQELPDNQ
jgi:hypothetical protein